MENKKHPSSPTLWFLVKLKIITSIAINILRQCIVFEWRKLFEYYAQWRASGRTANHKRTWFAACQPLLFIIFIMLSRWANSQVVWSSNYRCELVERSLLNPTLHNWPCQTPKNHCCMQLPHDSIHVRRPSKLVPLWTEASIRIWQRHHCIALKTRDHRRLLPADHVPQIIWEGRWHIDQPIIDETEYSLLWTLLPRYVP